MFAKSSKNEQSADSRQSEPALEPMRTDSMTAGVRAGARGTDGLWVVYLGNMMDRDDVPVSSAVGW